MTPLALAVLGLAVAVVLVAWARRRGTVVRTALVGACIAALVWGAAVAVQLTGWQDTDGWIDCHPQCDAWHEVGAVTFWTPPIVVLALLAVAVGALVHRLTAQR